MPSAIMENRRAIVLERPGVVEIMNVPLPVVRPPYALIKTTALSLHPIDPASIDYYGANGTIVGNDFAGIVEEVGSGVEQDLKPGDRVFGFVHGCKTDSMDVVTQLFKGSEPTLALSQEIGAFTDHTLAHGDILMKIPPHLSDAEAATFGAALTVAGMALYQVLGLKRPHEPYSRPVPILINGGATASGAMAIQLAKLSGMKVITCSSPENFSYLKALGADAIYDYKNPDWTRMVRRDWPMIELAYDTTCLNEGWARTEQCFSLSGGRAVVNQPPTETSRDDVTFQHVASYTCFGQRFSLGPIDCPDLPQQFTWSKEWWQYASKLMWDGKLKPHRPIIREGGLNGVLKGLNEVRQQKVRGHRLVYMM